MGRKSRRSRRELEEDEDASLREALHANLPMDQNTHLLGEDDDHDDYHHQDYPILDEDSPRDDSLSSRGGAEMIGSSGSEDANTALRPPRVVSVAEATQRRLRGQDEDDSDESMNDASEEEERKSKS